MFTIISKNHSKISSYCHHMLSPEGKKHSIIAGLYLFIVSVYHRVLSIRGNIKMITIVGTMGSILLALGSLGAGAVPTRGYWFSRIEPLRIFPRLPTAAAALVYMGVFMLFISWILLLREYFFIPHTHKASTQHVDKKLWRILLLWNLPVACGFPLFSQDIYSYFAQGEMYKKHFNPYALGPLNSLGAGNFFTSSVPNIWRNSPSPYGPLFILIAKIIILLVGHNLILAVIIYRILGIVGVALCCWAGLYLAKRYNLSPSNYLIIGIINPLVTMNAISAMHNDILMVGLAMSGMRLCTEAIDPPPVIRRNVFTYCKYYCHLSLLRYSSGIILISLACLIKVTAILAIPFVIIPVIQQIQMSAQPLTRTSLTKAQCNYLIFFITTYSFLLSLLTMVIVGWLTGLGFSWINVLLGKKGFGSFFSIASLCAKFVDYLSSSLRLGSHIQSLFVWISKIAQGIFLVFFIYIVNGCYRKKYDSIKSIGWIFFAFMILVPGIIQQWYLLWCLPIIALCYENVYWRIALILSGCCVFLITPGGHDLDEHLSSNAQLTCFIVICLACMYVIVKMRKFIIRISDNV